jgi:hypothetical protein
MAREGDVMKARRWISLIFTGVVATAAILQAQHHQQRAGDAQSLGDVVFPASCAGEVQDDFNRAVAMLHSFWYQASEKAFTTVAQKDSHCAMAYWGMAMSRFHQL